MRVVALLSWYDEPAAWLAQTVTSAAKLCDHVIAVDGAYALFPDSTRKPTSPPDQADTIARTARAAGIGVTIHTPTGPWWDGQTGKRDFMFRLADAVADPGDWLLRIDADETLEHVPADTRQQLADSEHDVAAVTLLERNAQPEVHQLVDAPPDYRTQLRVLYRQPAAGGLMIAQAHYVVVHPDGRLLNGKRRIHRVEPALPLPDVVLEHHTQHRPPHRLRMKRRYLDTIQELGVERVDREPAETAG